MLERTHYSGVESFDDRSSADYVFRAGTWRSVTKDCVCLCVCVCARARAFRAAEIPYAIGPLTPWVACITQTM